MKIYIQEVDVLTHDKWMISVQAVQVLEVFDILTTVLSSQNNITIPSIIIYLNLLLQSTIPKTLQLKDFLVSGFSTQKQIRICTPG